MFELKNDDMNGLKHEFHGEMTSDP